MKKISLSYVSQVRYSQVTDKDGFRSGKVGDLAFTGSVGKPLKIQSIIVGPSADDPNSTGLWQKLVHKISGTEKAVAIPWKVVKNIRPTVSLAISSKELSLGQGDRKFDNLIQKIPGG